MSRILPLLLVAWLASGCDAYRLAALDPRFRPLATLQSLPAQACRQRASAPLEEAVIATCIARLSDWQVAVDVHDRPEGQVLLRVLARGPSGEPVEVHARKLGWLLVVDRSGHRGWVHDYEAPLLRPEGPASERREGREP